MDIILDVFNLWSPCRYYIIEIDRKQSWAGGDILSMRGVEKKWHGVLFFSL